MEAAKADEEAEVEADAEANAARPTSGDPPIAGAARAASVPFILGVGDARWRALEPRSGSENDEPNAEAEVAEASVAAVALPASAADPAPLRAPVLEKRSLGSFPDAIPLPASLRNTPATLPPAKLESADEAEESAASDSPGAVGSEGVTAIKRSESDFGRRRPRRCRCEDLRERRRSDDGEP